MTDFLLPRRKKRVRIEVPMSVPESANYEIVVTERANDERAVFVVQDDPVETMTLKVRPDGNIFVAKETHQDD